MFNGAQPGYQQRNTGNHQFRQPTHQAHQGRLSFGQRSREDSVNMFRSRDNSLEYGSTEGSVDFNKSRGNSIEVDYNCNGQQKNFKPNTQRFNNNNVNGNVRHQNFNNNENFYRNNLIGVLSKDNAPNQNQNKFHRKQFTQVQSRAEPVSFLQKRPPQSRQPLNSNHNQRNSGPALFDKTNSILGNQQQQIHIKRKSYLENCIAGIQTNSLNSYGGNMQVNQQQQQLKNALPAGFGGRRSNNLGHKQLKVNTNSLTGGFGNLADRFPNSNGFQTGQQTPGMGMSGGNMGHNNYGKYNPMKNIKPKHMKGNGKIGMQMGSSNFMGGNGNTYHPRNLF